jgi:hypothetical protein
MTVLKSGDRFMRPTGGPLVWYATIFDFHPDTDETAYFWVAWDRSGVLIWTKPRGTLKDLRGYVRDRFQAGDKPCFMVRVGGLMNRQTLDEIQKYTAQ